MNFEISRGDYIPLEIIGVLGKIDGFDDLPGAITRLENRKSQIVRTKETLSCVIRLTDPRISRLDRREKDIDFFLTLLNVLGDFQKYRSNKTK